jgi:hypothetical protein
MEPAINLPKTPISIKYCMVPVLMKWPRMAGNARTTPKATTFHDCKIKHEVIHNKFGSLPSLHLKRKQTATGSWLLAAGASEGQ